MHTVVAAALIGGVLALVALIAGFRSRGYRRMALFVAVPVFLLPAGFVLVAVNPWMVDARFRTYREFYRSIEVGMTRDGVLETMERIYPTSGLRQRPVVMDDSPERLGFFMNPETSREPNCEGIFLKLSAGKVVGKSYSRD